MSVEGIGQAGSLESNDLMVTVDLTGDHDVLDITIESSVKNQFGQQIEKVVKQVADEYKMQKGKIQLVDKGALDFTIRARVKAALKRAGLQSHQSSLQGGTQS